MDKIMNTFFNELLPVSQAANANEEKNFARRQSLLKIEALFTKYKEDKIPFGKLHDSLKSEFNRLKDNSDGRALPIVERLLEELDKMKEYENRSRSRSKSTNRRSNSSRNRSGNRNGRSKSTKRNRSVKRKS